VPNLGAWSDRNYFLQVTSGRQSGGQYGGQSQGQYEGWGGGRVPRNGACFFMDADYRGDGFCMNAGESQQQVPDRFNDRISSIRRSSQSPGSRSPNMRALPAPAGLSR